MRVMKNKVALFLCIFPSVTKNGGCLDFTTSNVGYNKTRVQKSMQRFLLPRSVGFTYAGALPVQTLPSLKVLHEFSGESRSWLLSALHEGNGKCSH